MDDPDDAAYARAPEPEDLIRICRALNEAGARYVLIGGSAVVAHGASQRRQISTNGGKQPRWRQDGRELYYLDLDGELMAVPVALGAKIDSGVPRELFDTGLNVSLVADQYDVTPDGQRFLVLTPASEATPPPITVVVDWDAGLEK